MVIKAERLGSVCYIGKLDFDPSDTIYVGIHLDLPSKQQSLLLMNGPLIMHGNIEDSLWTIEHQQVVHPALSAPQEFSLFLYS